MLTRNLTSRLLEKMYYRYYFNYDDYGYDEYTNRAIEDSIIRLNKVFESSNYEVAVSHMPNKDSKQYSANLLNCDNNLHFDFAEFYLLKGKSKEECGIELSRQFNSFYESKKGLPDRIDFHQNMHKKYKLMRSLNDLNIMKSIKIRPLVQFPLHENWVFSFLKFISTYLYQKVLLIIFRNVEFGNELVVTNIHKATERKVRILKLFIRVFGYKILIPLHPHIYDDSEFTFITLLTKQDEI